MNDTNSTTVERSDSTQTNAQSDNQSPQQMGASSNSGAQEEQKQNGTGQQGNSGQNGNSSRVPVSSGQTQQGQQIAQRRDQGGLSRASHPFNQMRQMMEDMDRLSEAFGFPSMRRMGFPSFYDITPRGLGEMQQQSQQALWSPQVEVFEREGNVVVHADLPGLTKDDVTIEVEDDVLTLKGERKSQHEERSQGLYRSERSYGAFRRSFRLPEGANAEQIQANFQNGVLEIMVPKPQQQQQKSQRIEIK